ncbi:Oidioi.mRNA.OKI2018_I69.PAR.g8804.t1.cds [Oikopleura dioica]|uniref:Oidioi.mRNA.OKI2018_I69.PAR.g8804.t1.cds n=1 Tax=Oikopleura dioica TaxID=34765 RepID=A0ABN7RHP1_OIKDI|nr:Oidioi.mRNA.OKI2018_I69.PAR.g8804.t1.cds [Oikopleura dioica]
MLFNLFQLANSFCWIGIVANSVPQTSESSFAHIFFAAITVILVHFIISTSCTFLNHVGEKTSLKTVLTRGIGYSISWPFGLVKFEEIEDVSVAVRVEIMKGLGMALLLSNPGFFLFSECLFLIISRSFQSTLKGEDNLKIYEELKKPSLGFLAFSFSLIIPAMIYSCLLFAIHSTA